MSQKEFVEIVEARIQEIIQNVWYQVPDEYKDKLMGGIVLTGGGSNMKNIEKAFINHTHVEKIRTAKFVTQTILTNNEEVKSHNGMMNTVLGLLAKGDINCAGEIVNPNGDLFSTTKQATAHLTNDQRPARQATDIPAGVIRTEAEKQKAEEEKRRQQEEEERLKREEERRKKEEEDRIRKENSFWSKAFKRIKKFGADMVSEEE